MRPHGVLCRKSLRGKSNESARLSPREGPGLRGTSGCLFSASSVMLKSGASLPVVTVFHLG